ncbi:hypothetical protein KGQ20_34150 [Catenulispora sp. NF23]|uniref:hypothetical protein n=1 Tax=Catenulispora pinistramenti TaxID=2705254 RepID=UPI001BA6AD20|nr:hypothetical protein [Catenulispora pinistramenti]MBS2537808.1 hypothetical protein [Catenulispora pinistramenti]
MALTSKQKKQGAVVTAAVGALALGGVAVSTLGSSSSADSKPIVAAALPQPAAAIPMATTPSPSGSSATAITVSAKADNTKPADDTVFTISGEVKGAKPGTKIRLQRQQTASSTNASPAWSTLAYTTFTDKTNKFSFAVKMETAGSYNLRVLHPQDKEGPETAYSSPFAVSVSPTASSSASSKASSKASSAASSAKSPASSSSSKKG